MDKEVNVQIGDGQTAKVILTGLEIEPTEITVQSLTVLAYLETPFDLDCAELQERFAGQTKIILAVPDIPLRRKDDPTEYTGTYYQTVDTLEIATQRVREILSTAPILKRAYYYLPDTKTIVFIRHTDILCIDYGNLNPVYPGDLLVCSTRGTDKPLDTDSFITNPKKIKTLVSGANKFFAECGKSVLLNRHVCSRCKTKSAKLLDVCSRCRATCYCNVECQKQDWAGHKKTCVEIRSLHPNGENRVKVQYDTVM
jgi:hypothetical protein